MKLFLDSLNFSLETWTLELLIQLLEVNFSKVPTFVKEDVTDFASGLLSTLLKENQINEVRRYERGNGSGAVSACRAWHITGHSRHLEDFELPHAAMTNAAKAASNKRQEVPASVFNANESEEPCSLSDDLLDALSEKTFPSQSALTYRMAGMRLQCALHHDGNFKLIQSSWWSVIV